MKKLKIKNKIRLSIFFALLVLISALHIIFNFNNKNRPPSVMINGKEISVEIVDTPLSRQQGLSDRENLDVGSGMLFIFGDKQPRSFWMKNMNFPIDIIWIDDDKVVKIDENLTPEGETPENHYNSKAPVNYVLEVNAGFSAQNNINIGDSVKINK